MLLRKNNRGAGLVSVVVVLAVAGILLSSALWLSTAHYKSALNDEANGDIQREFDLCARLVCMTLDENVEFSIDGLRSGNALENFYGLPETPEESENDDDAMCVPVDSGMIFIGITDRSYLLLVYGENGSEPIEAWYEIQKVDGYHVFRKVTQSEAEATDVSEETEVPE